MTKQNPMTKTRFVMAYWHAGISDIEMITFPDVESIKVWAKDNGDEEHFEEIDFEAMGPIHIATGDFIMYTLVNIEDPGLRHHS